MIWFFLLTAEYFGCVRFIAKYFKVQSYGVQMFNGNQSLILYSYNFMGSELCVYCIYGYVIDLDFKLSGSLDPRLHIDMICCKVLKVLGFVMRLTKEFTLKNSVKTLYCALVCHI